MNANATEMLRLFFALWPDDATRTSLMQLQALIRGRTVLYNNLHLTLAFLGPQPAAVLASAKEILTHLSSPATSLTLDRLGYFTRKRLAWVGAHQVPDELVSLQKELRDGLLQRGITFDDRKDFKAHITLARDASLPPDIVFDPIVWHTSQVALVQSATDDQGTAYRVLASRSLDQR